MNLELTAKERDALLCRIGNFHNSTRDFIVCCECYLFNRKAIRCTGTQKPLELVAVKLQKAKEETSC